MWKVSLFCLLLGYVCQGLRLPQDGEDSITRCYVCTSPDEGVPCDSTQAGDLLECPSEMTGCRITEGHEGGTDFFERACTDESEVGCTKNTVDGMTDHACICKGEGCNQNWESAGDTQDNTTPKCYFCNSLEDGVECDETHTGDLTDCPMENAVGCRITQGMGGETDFFERSCAGEIEDIGCNSNSIDGMTDHECICKGDGCNKDWEAAGETGEQTTGAPAEDLRCYVCKQDYRGGLCDAENPGTLESCPMGDAMGCLLSQYKDKSSGEDVYTRACTDRDSYVCADYAGEDGGDFHECVCQKEGCNKDWTSAGDTEEQTTTDKPVLNCYVCKTEPGAPPCNEENPGPLESCPPESSSGCLISRMSDQSSGEDLYTRSCADTSFFECRDFQADEGGEFAHECVCQGDGCNLNWSNAGETTTPDGVEKRCYECSTAKGDDCSEMLVGTEVYCHQPRNKGCLISKEPGENGNNDLFIRGCADADDFHCTSELNIHTCICQDDMCNQNFDSAGDGNTSAPEEKMKCYECNSLFDNCTEEYPGVETDCNKKTGCSISEDGPEEIAMDVEGYVFKYVPWPHREVYFQVKSPHDVHLALAPDEKYEDRVNEDDVYEFVLGGWGNQKSLIRRGNQGKELANAETIDIISAEEYRNFWISTALRDGKLELKLGKAGDKNALMTGLDENPVEIKYLGLASWAGVTASYKNVKPVNSSVLSRGCGSVENFGCTVRTDGDLELKFCNCRDERCNMNWSAAGSTDQPPDTTAQPSDGMQCYVCKQGEEGDSPCDEIMAGELQQCPEDKNAGCLISKSTVGDAPSSYTRSCSASKAFPCRDYDGDQENQIIHECLCEGNGCNKDWSTAGDNTSDTTAHPGEGKQCYSCSTLEGEDCSDFVIGEPVTCAAPMDKGCFISHMDDIYIRDCADSTEDSCIDNENGRMCTCQADLCNKDFFSAGDTNGTQPGEALKCYVCKPGEEINASCDEFEAGELQQCPEDTNAGCLISKLTVGDSLSLYTRSCSGSHAFPCRDYDGDQEDSFIHECICEGNGCNKDWTSAGDKPSDTTTPAPGGLQCFKCDSLDGDCDTTHLGKVSNCATDKGCLISYESTAGKANVYARDCAQGGEHRCDKVDSGNSVLRFCICDGNLCNESWDSAGSTAAHPTGGPPTEPQTTEQHTQGTYDPTAAPNSAFKNSFLYSLSVWLLLFLSII